VDGQVWAGSSLGEEVTILFFSVLLPFADPAKQGAIFPNELFTIRRSQFEVDGAEHENSYCFLAGHVFPSFPGGLIYVLLPFLLLSIILLHLFT
jgi:hypothetical protein